MGYASYSENIAERFYERFSELLRVVSQVKRGHATGEDLSIALQQKLHQILTDLAGLMTELQKNLDDPSIVQVLSAKSLSEVLSQSEQLDATNLALRDELVAAKQQVPKYERSLKNLHDAVGKLEISNAKLRKENKVAREEISKLQKRARHADVAHSARTEKLNREILALQGRNRELSSELNSRIQQLEEQLVKDVFRDVRPIKRR